MTSEIVARLARNLVHDEPSLRGERLAGVSVILRDIPLPSVLLIRRAEHPGDPWSGQIAFPGGKMQAGDKTARDAAVRETLEEVGVDLEQVADFLGYAGVIPTHTGAMDVVPSVFVLKGEAELALNAEVASHRWVALGDLMSPGAKTTYPLSYGGNSVEMPAYSVEDYVVWGLTYRILSALLEGFS